MIGNPPNTESTLERLKKLDRQNRWLKAIGIALGALTVIAIGVPVGQKPPTFFFGGNELYVGMPEPTAISSLSECCNLSPPPQKQRSHGSTEAYFIFSKETHQQLIGTVYISEQKVVRITRPLDKGIDTGNEHVVAFARAIDRSLSPEFGDSGALARVSVYHERLSNGEGDHLSLVFLNGRGIVLTIGNLDKPQSDTGRRDFATLDEVLQQSK